MRPSKPWLTRVIVIAVILLVFIPIWLPSEIARWYIAAAANALRTDDEQAAHRMVEVAAKWDPTIEEPDSQALVPLVRIAFFQADKLAWHGEFDMALEFVQRAFRFSPPRTPMEFNQLAYFRALAGRELEEALADIQHAKSIAPNQPEMEDTHAWILHKLDRNLEALGYANASVAGIQLLRGIDPKSESSDSSTSQANPTSPSAHSDSNALSKDETELPVSLESIHAQVDPIIWTEGVVRFHRMRILESLKEFKRADIDREWLQRHGVPESDQLF